MSANDGCIFVVHATLSFFSDFAFIGVVETGGAMDVAAVKIVERRASFFGDCVAVEGFYESATIAENGGIIQTILRKFG